MVVRSCFQEDPLSLRLSLPDGVCHFIVGLWGGVRIISRELPRNLHIDPPNHPQNQLKSAFIR